MTRVLWWFGVACLVAGVLAMGALFVGLASRNDARPVSIVTTSVPAPIATTVATPSTTVAAATTTTSSPPTTTTSPELVITPGLPPPLVATPGLRFSVVAEGLDEPVAAVRVPGTVDHFLVVERPGYLSLVAGGSVSRILDMSDRVTTEYSEQGLLSVAFHPEFTGNGRLFVSYTALDRLVRVVELAGILGPPLGLTATPERLIMELAMSARFHNGGMLRFGPDGHLWIGIGDGGPFFDPEGHGQDPNTLRGSLLRIDVDATEPYGIPPGNAFETGSDGRAEIFAYGLRNPWTFTFDNQRLFIFDVGDVDWEEVNVITVDMPGANFGWAKAEGFECFPPDQTECDLSDTVAPALVLSHATHCAVVGGPVYRGTAIPYLAGHLLLADFCRGTIVSFEFDGLEPAGPGLLWEDLAEPTLTSFAEDALGEVYVTTLSGMLLKIIPEPVEAPVDAPVENV